MKRIMLAAVAATALSFPALAQHAESPRAAWSQVEKIQQSLDDKGFKSGQVDGKRGPQTMSALKDFQKSQNMSSTGDLDGQTIAALGLYSSDFGLS